MGHVTVELVEDDEHEPRPDAAGAEPPGVLAWVRRRPLVAVAAGVAVVAIVAAAVVVEAVQDARVRARVARLADVPGVLRVLDPPLRTQLHLEGDAAAVLQGGQVVGGLVVGGVAGPAGQDPGVLAIDARTGAQVWRRPLAPPPDPAALPAELQGEGPSDNVWCQRATGAHRVGCTVSRMYGWIPASTGDQFGRSVDVTSYVLLDARDGSVLARRDTTLGTLVWPDADGVWLAVPDADGAGVTVESLRADTSERWTAHVEVPAGVSERQPLVFAPSDDEIVLVVGNRGWAFDPSDGSPEGRYGDGTGQWDAAEVVDGGLAVTSYSSAGAPATRVWHRDGTSVAVRSDEQLWMQLDDGSRPGLLLSYSSDAGAGAHVDRQDAEGHRLWRAPVRAGTSGILVDGTLVLNGGDQLSAVDADTGKVHWTRTMPRVPQQLFTDGVHVVAVTGPQVDGYDFDTGEPQWSARLTDLPDGTVTLDRVRVTPSPSQTLQEDFVDGWWWVAPDGRLAYSRPDRGWEVLVLG